MAFLQESVRTRFVNTWTRSNGRVQSLSRPAKRTFCQKTLQLWCIIAWSMPRNELKRCSMHVVIGVNFAGFQGGSPLAKGPITQVYLHIYIHVYFRTSKCIHDDPLHLSQFITFLDAWPLRPSFGFSLWPDQRVLCCSLVTSTLQLYHVQVPITWILWFVPGFHSANCSFCPGTASKTLLLRPFSILLSVSFDFVRLFLSAFEIEHLTSALPSFGPDTRQRHKLCTVTECYILGHFGHL